MERRLAEFQLIKQLGQGALGKVYLAEHVFMKKQFALKVLPEELANDRAFIQRFEQEIAALSQLDHPSIAKIHQATFADGCYFIVTDLAIGPEGEPLNLQQYLNARKEPLSEAELLELLTQVASALDYIHARRRHDGASLAHLSLRPSNILVTGRLNQPRLMLTDVGLHRLVGQGRVLSYLMAGVAKEMEESQEERSDSHELCVAQFRRQSFHRAFQFLAPEQKRADGDQGSASDLFAFGVLAYYLLVGDLPEGVFELPSLLRDDLECNWDRMIMGCLSARAQRRPHSLAQLMAAVQSSRELAEAVEQPLSQNSLSRNQSPKLTPISGTFSTHEPSSSRGLSGAAPVAALERLQPNSPVRSTQSVEIQSSVLDRSAQGPLNSSSVATRLDPPSYRFSSSAQRDASDASQRGPCPRPSCQADDPEALSMSFSSRAIGAASEAPENSGVTHETRWTQGLSSSPSSTASDAHHPSSRYLSQGAMGLEAASAAASFPAGQAAVVHAPAPSVPSILSAPKPASSSLSVESTAESGELATQSSSFLHHYPVNTPRNSQVDTGVETEPLLTPMCPIQGGRYLRGSNNGSRDEMPRHGVVLADFAIDIHPVTNEQFVRFLRVLGAEKDENNNDIIRLKESRVKRVGGKLLIEPGYHRHPVVGVTWYGAVAYCKWIGKRLPTEAEWEIAARGGIEDALYPTGDEIEKSQANFFNSDTTSVMSYPPNGYELYDMAGNVYEWCQDWYAYNTYELTASEPMMPQGPLQGVYRVLRGGCWKSLNEDLRCAHRHRNNPGAVNRTYGFRCASDAVSPARASAK